VISIMKFVLRGVGANIDDTLFTETEFDNERSCVVINNNRLTSKQVMNIRKFCKSDYGFGENVISINYDINGVLVIRIKS
jgi:hypothetical protein